MERSIPIDPILEKGYNVRLLVDDFDGLIEKWSNWSEVFRSNADSALNCQYGNGEKDKLDIFRCGKPNAPLFIFIHGGYWQRGDKSVYSFVAQSFVNSGIDVALIGYQLCPGASMTNIIEKSERQSYGYGITQMTTQSLNIKLMSLVILQVVISLG